jgi:hypothetical protein
MSEVAQILRRSAVLGAAGVEFIEENGGGPGGAAANAATRQAVGRYFSNVRYHLTL